MLGRAAVDDPRAAVGGSGSDETVDNGLSRPDGAPLARPAA